MHMEGANPLAPGWQRIRLRLAMGHVAHPRANLRTRRQGIGALHGNARIILFKKCTESCKVAHQAGMAGEKS